MPSDNRQYNLPGNRTWLERKTNRMNLDRKMGIRYHFYRFYKPDWPGTWNSSGDWFIWSGVHQDNQLSNTGDPFSICTCAGGHLCLLNLLPLAQAGIIWSLDIMSILLVICFFINSPYQSICVPSSRRFDQASLNSRTLVRSAKSYASVYNQNSILI